MRLQEKSEQHGVAVSYTHLAMGKTPAIIMVTSANDTDIVRSLLSRGVLDYLVKPFEYARFRTALELSLIHI